MSEEFKVFCSWQSDSPNNTNHYFIMNGLEKAAQKLGHSSEFPDLKVLIDEATRDESGSINIPETVLKKIAKCNAFVCDITTINPCETNARYRTANNNVVFELGYAVAMLGWERIVLLFNVDIGKFPDDMPFDFDRQRTGRNTQPWGQQ